MESPTWVQFLDESVRILDSVNTIEKGMNTIILPSTMIMAEWAL